MVDLRRRLYRVRGAGRVDVVAIAAEKAEQKLKAGDFEFRSRRFSLEYQEGQIEDLAVRSPVKDLANLTSNRPRA